MGKRYRAATAPTPLKGTSAGVPMGKATHTVRVMHRECVTRTARDHWKLRKLAYAVVEYRGTRPARVLFATDDERFAHTSAYRMANDFDRKGDPASVRELHTCRKVKVVAPKARHELTQQDLHVADIDNMRECRACSSRDKSRLCKPNRAGKTERMRAQTSHLALVSANRSDDTPSDPNIITRWAKDDE